MSLLIKYVDYDEEQHLLKVTAYRHERNEETFFLSNDTQERKPEWLSDKEYYACLYLFQCIDSIRNGEYLIHHGDYFKRNDLKLVSFTVESKYINAQVVELEYLFVGKSFGAVRFKDVPSLMVNVPYFKVLENLFLKTSPHRLRLLI